MVLHARFDGRVLVPTEPVELPTDRLLELEVRETDASELGTPELILKVLRSLPPLEPGDADALMREIEAGQQPAEYKGIFDEEAETGE